MQAYAFWIDAGPALRLNQRMPQNGRPWWKNTTVYQIYPRSFFDSSGDGVGDLWGIEQKLAYLRDLGVETLWISPFFKSPQRDFGYDISDYEDIAPEYGTMSDCQRLIEGAHRQGMKVVLDLVLNHTSDEHPWFMESRSSKTNPMRDFYLWRPGQKPGGKAPPNNWKSLIGGSGWHYDPRTSEWYWASFLPFQPDLNYRNPSVRAEMLAMVKRWLDRGADGFRLDLFNAIYKDDLFRNNPWSPYPLPCAQNPWGFFQKRLYSTDLEENFEFAAELRSVLDSAEGDRFMVGEVFGDMQTLRRYCGSPEKPGLHLIFLFQLLHASINAGAIRNLLLQFEELFPEPYSPTLVLGNHDQIRLMNRVKHSAEKARLLAALQLTARGVPFLYYGEELGMKGSHIPLKEGKDPIATRYAWVPDTIAMKLSSRGILLNRDESRTPMAWSPGPHGGFCLPDTEPWLPLHGDFHRVNVQSEHNDPASMLQLYKRLLLLRKEKPALHAGSIRLFRQHDDYKSLLGYRREAGSERADIWMNTGEEALVVNFQFENRPRLLFSTHITHMTAGTPMPCIGKSRMFQPFEAIVCEPGHNGLCVF